MKHKDFLATLESDPGTESYNKQHQVKIDLVKQKFLENIRSGVIPKTVYGAYGPETPSSDAYLEDIIKPPEGGTYLKLYGCSYLYKGDFTAERVHALQMPKALLSEDLANLLKLPFVGIGFFLTFLFNRKRFLKFLNDFTERLEWRVMRHYDIPESEYNEFSQEIKRSLRGTIWNDFLAGDFLARIIWRITRFVCLVLETDNAYRLRIQDAIERAFELYRSKMTIINILDVLISRETKYGIAHKWKMIRLALLLALPLYPELRSIIQNTLSSLDVDKIKMDDADWYFSLRFRSYDFRGLSYGERIAIQKRLDLEKGHVFLI